LAWDLRGTVVELAKRTVRGLYSEAARCADESRRKAIVAHAMRSEKATAIAAFLKLAESDPRVAVLPDELDTDPWLLNCKNGTLDLRTGRLRAPSPNDLITKVTPVANDSKASSELWNGNRGDLVRLSGARLVTSSEVRPRGRWDTTLMKALTGGDTIVAAAKYEDSVEFRPSCTLILCANDAPVLRDDDAGMWARIRRIPLTAQIPAEQQDRELKFKLQRPEHASASRSRT
jgi:phage/plasmid-associated DNA primase